MEKEIVMEWYGHKCNSCEYQEYCQEAYYTSRIECCVPCRRWSDGTQEMLEDGQWKKY